jgi:hypothetical protein
MGAINIASGLARDQLGDIERALLAIANLVREEG